MVSLLLLIQTCTVPPTLPLKDSIPDRYRKFQTSINTIGGEKRRGYLYDLDDSTISLTPWLLEKKELLTDNTIQRVPFTSLSTVQLKRHNSVGRGAIFGALIGAGGGALGGFASGDDDPKYWFRMTAGEKALGLGLLFGIAGTIVGLIVGAAARRHFTIGGRKDKFQKMKADLLHRANTTPAR